MPSRKTLSSTLGTASLTTPEAAALSYDPVAMMPDVKVLKIGGQSILDRGREAVFPIIEELVTPKPKSAKAAPKAEAKADETETPVEESEVAEAPEQEIAEDEAAAEATEAEADETAAEEPTAPAETDQTK